jgi:hypothetical protein
LISLERRKRLDSHCRAYVVGNGKKAKHEYLIGYCLNSGKILGRHTDKSTNSVSIPKNLSRHLTDKKRRCSLHHNHPGGTSLSREDLYNLANLPGTLIKFAHGHQGQWYRAETLRERNLAQILVGGDKYFMRAMLENPALAARVPKIFRHHIFNIGLDKAKVIHYTYQLDPANKLGYNQLLEDDVNLLVKSVVAGVSSERSLK